MMGRDAMLISINKPLMLKYLHVSSHAELR
jgi:hypothetical protein